MSGAPAWLLNQHRAAAGETLSGRRELPPRVRPFSSSAANTALMANKRTETDVLGLEARPRCGSRRARTSRGHGADVKRWRRLTLADPSTVVIATQRTPGSAEAGGQQDAARWAGGAGERPRPTAGVT